MQLLAGPRALLWKDVKCKNQGEVWFVTFPESWEGPGPRDSGKAGTVLGSEECLSLDLILGSRAGGGLLLRIVKALPALDFKPAHSNFGPHSTRSCVKDWPGSCPWWWRGNLGQEAKWLWGSPHKCGCRSVWDGVKGVWDTWPGQWEGYGLWS